MSWAQQAAHGAWLFKIKYTALPHAPFLFHPFFLICGWLSALFSCEIGIVFWLVKAVGVALLFVSFYRYIDYLGLNTTQSFAASILVGISSGFGAMVVWSGLVVRNLAAVPTDLWMPEVNTFWSLLWNPLFPFSLTLMLLSIFWLDRGTQQNRGGDLWLSGAAAGVMALIHPYSLPLLFALTLIVAIARRKLQASGYLLRYFAASVPFAVYVAALSRLNPLLGQHSLAGQMKSPSLPAYALGFGLPLLLYVAGVVLLRGKLLKTYWHIILWFFLAVAFAYLPFWFQRKLIFGSHIPLCIVSGIVFGSALDRWLPKRKREWPRIAAALLSLPLFASTSYYLLVWENGQVTADRDRAYYVDNETVEALEALQARSRPEDVVFATYGTSRLIPAFAGNTTIWGHWAMSVDYQERQATMIDIFDMESNLNDQARADMFWGSGIHLVFADRELKQSMVQHPFLWGVILKDTRKIFENESVTIYQRQTHS